MISQGRYLYHLQDIAEIEAMEKPLNWLQQTRLDAMKQETAEFESAYPADAAAMQQRAKELAGK